MKKAILALLVVLVASIGVVSAFGGRLLDEESKEAIKEALEAKDYEAWKEAVTATLTEEHFEKVVEMHGKRSEMREMKEAAKGALDEGNYEAWRESMEGFEKEPRILNKIDEGNFDTLVELHQAKQDGNKELAKELRDELGIRKGRGRFPIYGPGSKGKQWKDIEE